MREKTLEMSKSWKPKVASKKQKVEVIFKLIDVIETKVGSLKHGYIAENEFGQLKLLVSKL